ncbi:Leucine-rich repeat protein kinase family protein [Rhynchospora pubera]|uniref:Leucine-rich repeat protein kinase family protein n=1 Tax=Rhynchospora pubera TaxID=906938 RepID=A0AAV8H0H4_9POAL|nr:Leucine-rich repeat protein kinase family protein [Rhynchospora pubera]
MAAAGTGTGKLGHLYSLIIFLWLTLLFVQQELSESESATEDDTDQLALLSFKGAIRSDPSGAMSSWNTSLALCHWTGVTCTQQQQKQRRVSGLILESINLTGTISPSLANLTQLTTLRLAGNMLTGEIPSVIGTLSSLSLLDLSSNYFSGRIPNSIGQLSNLEGLLLFNNRLSGGIPSSIGNLSRLYECRLDDNQLQGEIPSSIGNCQKLIF